MLSRAASLSLSLALFVALAAPAAAQVKAADAPARPVRFEADSYSPPINWRTPIGWWAVAVHATLMPDGRILCIGYERENELFVSGDEQKQLVFAMTPTPLGQPLPTDAVVVAENTPLDFKEVISFPFFINDDLFCTGNMLTADGEFLSVGGTRITANLLTLDFDLTALPYATTWDGSTWTRVPQDMQVIGPLGIPGRWYPSITKLADGRMFVASGLSQIFPTPLQNRSTEIFDPAAGTWTVHTDHPGTPTTLYNPDYTHAFLLPQQVSGYDLLAFGAAGQPLGISLSGPVKWLKLPQYRPGTHPLLTPNQGASSAMLPVRVVDGEWGYSNGSVAIAGGDHGTLHMRRFDVFDPVTSTWRNPLDLRIKRHHPSTVLLPDGRVLVVAGHDEITLDPGVMRAQIVDPATGFSVKWGRAQEEIVRGYHTISLLLPDGRVLLGGGRDHDTVNTAEKSNFRYYFPEYMTKPRPTIVTAPGKLAFGTGFLVTTTGNPPAEFVLMALGSMTHSIDMNQRYVQLETSGTLSAAGTHVTGLVAPPNGVVAPPGYYMLFVLDDERVPSIARIVQLS